MSDENLTEAELRERNAELEQLFDLRWAADMRAIRLWQAETGNKDVWPDHTDLVVWLLQHWGEMRQLLEESLTLLKLMKPDYEERAAALAAIEDVIRDGQALLLRVEQVK